MVERTNAEVMSMWREMRPLRNAGYMLMPLTAKTLPRDKGWPSNDYSQFDAAYHLGTGGAVAVRLGFTDLVIDVDPRNGGDESFGRLCADVGTDLSHAPHVLTGGGGHHYYWCKPPTLRTRVTLPAYPGIDFKRGVGYVIAPGSTHAKTGRLYRWATAPQAAVQAPEPLLALLAEPAHERGPRGDGGEITPEELGRLLSVIDARKYGKGSYDDWIRFAAACHDATEGDGFDEWADWCRTDPEYADVDDDLLMLHWESFRVGKPEGVTFRTLFRAVSLAGRRDLLRGLGAQIDFDADDLPDLDFEVR